MIAACPRCQAKYRVDVERLSPEGARLRCAKCEAVFRVRAPQAAAAPAQAPGAPAPAPVAAAAPRPVQAPAPPPPRADLSPPAPHMAAPAMLQPSIEPDPNVDRERLVVVADPDVESGKRVIHALSAWGLQPVLVHDGVEAMLTIQRLLPRAAILDAALPKMYGFQICEMVKRNESLRSIHVALVGSVHHQDRYRRPPTEMYGADAYMEKPELPEGLAPVLQRFGYAIQGAVPERAAAPVAAMPVQAAAAPPRAVAAPPPATAPAVPAPRPVAAAPQPVATAAAAPQGSAGDDGLAEQRANAERLARIIVSDILLYHPEQFAQGLASGKIGAALEAAITEGRGFFAQRVDPRVRDERDFIMDELKRVARERAGQ